MNAPFAFLAHAMIRPQGRCQDREVIFYDDESAAVPATSRVEKFEKLLTLFVGAKSQIEALRTA